MVTAPLGKKLTKNFDERTSFPQFHQYFLPYGICTDCASRVDLESSAQATVVNGECERMLQVEVNTMCTLKHVSFRF